MIRIRSIWGRRRDGFKTEGITFYLFTLNLKKGIFSANLFEGTPKVLLFAKDNEIQDPTILSQIDKTYV